MGKKLYRSRTKRMISGVCGGLSDFLSIDETLVRLGVALAAAMTAFVPVAIFYFMAVIIVPEEPTAA